ncbi:Terminal organelle assembly protein [Parasponia andersonii]|uniref:Terminal organelle assembly protein n=1 Tax=Parasponia andersonii TaxID=3476 RepID=A0A2P5DBN3_PARAD|nr:Terminal organelle assembly protein [Parasponia andersonii]
MISTASFPAPKVVSQFQGNHSPNSRTGIGFRGRISVSASRASTVERAGSRIASTSSLYEVLGIRMGATCQEIKTAYRRLARVVHPDVAVANGQRGGQASADEFMKIHEAYSTLSDPDRRADYDRRLFGQQWAATSGFSGGRPRTWETDQCW